MDKRRPQPTIQVPALAPNNLTSIPLSGINPSRSDTRQSQKRKQTLLTLLDALTELNSHGLDQDSSHGTLVDDEQEGPTSDEQLQAKGAEVFHRFQKAVQQLDKELQNFANAVRQLGSSVGLLSSSFQLRQCLAQILFLFRENAAELFPRKVKHGQREMQNMHIIQQSMRKKNSRAGRKQKSIPSLARPIVQPDLEPGDIPEELEALAGDVVWFLESLNEFPEFTDEAVNASIVSFEGDLKYWASCLRDFQGQFRYPAVERYVHDLSGEMCSHIEAITATISVFVEVGVPTIRFAQKHTATNLLNLSTVATFFSAVTATTIQFSFNLIDGPLQNAVNAFWFSSLVFSIASAVNSLLGLTWKQAMYRSPKHRVPWWVLIWIKRSPLIFLVISVAAFSVGLVLFTWGSSQHRTTCILTTVFTSFSSFGLIAVSAWFAFERYAYTRHKGHRWLADILADLNVDIRKYSGMDWLEDNVPIYFSQAREWTSDRVDKVASKSVRLAGSSKRILSKIFCSWSFNHSGGDIENGTLPLPGQMQQRESQVIPPTPRSIGHHRISDASVTFRTESPLSMSPTMTLPSPEVVISSTEKEKEKEETANDPPKRSRAKSRFANVVRSVIMLQNASSSSPGPTGTARKISGMASAIKAFENGTRKGSSSRRDSAETFTAAKLSRIIHLRNSLKHLEVSETLLAHQALVRHLQFSPNGKWLATCSWDRTSVLFKVGTDTELFSVHRTLAHPQGFVHQVAWSPKGTYLLTKLQKSVKIWSEDGVCVKTIDRRHHIQSVTWMPSGKEFLLVEGHDVHKVDLQGKHLATYHLPRLWTHDVAVTPCEERLLAVGTLAESPDGLQPHKARKEKRILVYNMAEKQIESQVPVLHSVRDVTIASGGQLALVSYEDKAPPQLWRLDKVNDDVRLSLRHTYMPTADIDFVGTSYFGGRDDQLILCAAKNGHVHIWDRESATLLHDIRISDGDLTGIAWNTGADLPMFATGSHDGAVKIWTSSVHQTGFDSRIGSRPSSSMPSGSRSESPSPPVLESPGPMQGYGYLDAPTAASGRLSRNTSRRSRRDDDEARSLSPSPRTPSRAQSPIRDSL